MLMTGDAMPCACVVGAGRGLLRQTLMSQMAGNLRMCTYGIHALASEPGSVALWVTKRITEGVNEAAFQHF